MFKDEVDQKERGVSNEAGQRCFLAKILIIKNDLRAFPNSASSALV